MIIYLYKKVDDTWVQQAVDAANPTDTTYDIDRAIALSTSLSIEVDYVVGYGHGYGPSVEGHTNKRSQYKALDGSYQVDDWDVHNLLAGATQDLKRALQPAVGGGPVFLGVDGTFTRMDSQPYWATVSNADETI